MLFLRQRKDLQKESTDSAQEKLKSQVDDLVSKVRALDGRMKHIELEWESAFLKLRSTLGSISKREGLLRKREEESEIPPTPTPVMEEIAPQEPTSHENILQKARNQGLLR